MNKIDYRQAGVDIEAGQEAVERIRQVARSTYSPAVLAGIGGFGSLFDLQPALKNYRHPVLVQSIDGVGTKLIVARMMKVYDTIGIDLLSACCNDIIVMGARPFTFLDYIANDRLVPAVVEEIVSGLSQACREIGVSLVGGETAEMPDTYQAGEQDLVGVVSGLVEKDRMIDGSRIQPGDIVLGLPSSGLHTNGYSLARKIFFDLGGYSVDSILPELDQPLGPTLLEPHRNYTLPVLELLQTGREPKAMAHITGGGLLDNIPRVLPDTCGAEIEHDSWPVPPVFQVLKTLGDLPDSELYRTFNMGLGLTLIVAPEQVDGIRTTLKEYSPVYEIGRIRSGAHHVRIV